MNAQSKKLLNGNKSIWKREDKTKQDATIQSFRENIQAQTLAHKCSRLENDYKKLKIRLKHW